MINRKGFTLIEMLVVIAIIGILSAAVLVSLGPSRTKAKDARIISGLEQARVLLETRLDANLGTYEKIVWTAEPYSPIADDIKANNQNLALGEVPEIGGTAVAIYAKLAGDGYYCVDTSGNSRSAASFPLIGVCP